MALAEFDRIEVLETLEKRVAPEHTALLVIDMQHDYCSPGGATERNGRDLESSRAIIPALRGLIDAARRVGIPILFTRYTIGPGTVGCSGPELLRRRRIFEGDRATIKGTWGHEVIPEMGQQPEDFIIDKRRPSSFVGTDLDLFLRSSGVMTLVVTGVVTQGCVESTVRDAVGLDYYVAVVEDCVASSDPEQHASGLRSMARHLQYAEGVVPSQRLRSIWSSSLRHTEPLPAATVSPL